MLQHHYSSTTGEYLGASEVAESPLEPGVYLTLAYTTPNAPPTPGEHQTPVFRDSRGSAPELYGDGAWELVSDWRSFEYWLSDRSHHTIRELGVEPPEGYLTEEPLRPQEEINAELAVTARGKRDYYLESTQWMVQRHRDEIEMKRTATLTNEQYIELQTYRQVLRDIPDQPGFPANVEWPTKPEWVR